jgi:hypothetical protein
VGFTWSIVFNEVPVDTDASPAVRSAVAPFHTAKRLRAIVSP